MVSLVTLNAFCKCINLSETRIKMINSTVLWSKVSRLIAFYMYSVLAIYPDRDNLIYPTTGYKSCCITFNPSSRYKDSLDMFSKSIKQLLNVMVIFFFIVSFLNVRHAKKSRTCL